MGDEVNFVKNNKDIHNVYISDLSKTYDNKFTALNNITVGVKEGEIMGLLGPNGAGKSTLFNIMSLNLRRSRGDVTLLKEDIGKNITKILPDIGICPQENVIWENMSVVEHFQILCRLKGLNL